ncbi:MAG TPA: hypothetical protein PLX02_14355 [Syntrophorhabdaceae bacterium]|nr:hypothetical protein [Syntrophorhabdaceae bacterium]HQM82791.1 hypothetical protein [Syntrophorhabdaceae bacterium]
MKSVITIVVSVMIFFSASSTMFGSDTATATLDEAVKRISAVLKEVDKSLSGAAGRIGKGLDAQSDLRGAIKGLCAGKPYAIDCSFVNAKGVIEIMEPEKYRKHEGANLSAQAVTAGIMKNKKPVFSELFIGIEETQAALFGYPVFNARNEFVGSVGIYFTPEFLAKDALKGLTLGKGIMILVIQGDGTHVFSSDPAQSRRNVLKSAEYQGFPELKGLVGYIVSQEEGSGPYRYVKPGTQQVIKKKAHWKTVSLYDGFWRIVVTEPEKP